jgi:hypothetical protein
MSGFKDLIGFTPETEEVMMGPGGAGVVLHGLSKNPATTATLTFSGNVSIDGCGKLVADGHNYTIDKRPGSLQVTVQNEPHPIVLTEVRHDIDSSGDFAVLAGDKFFVFKGGI